MNNMSEFTALIIGFYKKLTLIRVIRGPIRVIRGPNLLKYLPTFHFLNHFLLLYYL